MHTAAMRGFAIESTVMLIKKVQLVSPGRTSKQRSRKRSRGRPAKREYRKFMKPPPSLSGAVPQLPETAT